MFLDPVFERFVQDCPLPDLFRGLLDQALPPAAIDEVFEATATQQYTGSLLFSSVVELLGLAVCQIRPSVHADYQARHDRLTVSLSAVYAKLGGVEPAVTAALVRASAHRLRPVLTELGGGPPPLLPGYAVRILDGNYLALTEHRLRALRGTRAAALPGMSVVVLDRDARLVCDLFPCENGHAQERALLPAVPQAVQPGAKSGWATATTARRACWLGCGSGRRTSWSASMPRRLPERRSRRWLRGVAVPRARCSSSRCG